VVNAIRLGETTPAHVGKAPGDRPALGSRKEKPKEKEPEVEE
jgi:hypothetical protein